MTLPINRCLDTTLTEKEVEEAEQSRNFFIGELTVNPAKCHDVLHLRCIVQEDKCTGNKCKENKIEN